MLTFALKLSHRSDGLVTAMFPDVPGAVAHGSDDAEAYDNAVAALKRALNRYVGAGFDLPTPRTPGRLAVSVEPPQITALA